jgi:LmbE family N-acetylglucosaminyl deacetylase
VPATRRERFRLELRALLAFGLRRRSRPFPIEANRSAWVLAPHPDDDAFGCGGLILLKRLEGLSVRIAYLTDGAASHPGHPSLVPRELARRRQTEALAAAGILGVEQSEVHFLGAADGTLKDLDRPAAARLVAALAADLRAAPPDDIFLPCRNDGSSEHVAAFPLVAQAAAQLDRPVRLLEYPVWAWWNPLRLTRPLCSSRRIWRVDYRGYEVVKRRAIRQHATQLEPVAPWRTALMSSAFQDAFLSGEEYFFETDRTAG